MLITLKLNFFNWCEGPNLKLFIRKLALFYKTVTNIADSDIKCQSKINRAVFSISDVKKYVAY